MTSNLRHWSALYKTDPDHTKPFDTGRFKGTATKPIYHLQRLTEHFGPCGVSWGMDRPEFSLVPAGEELLVFCTVTLWYMDDGDTKGIVYGVGGDKVLRLQKDGRSFISDESYKAAYTDALGNAMKHLGIGADVHMGLFEDNKYVRELRDEFRGEPSHAPAAPPARLARNVSPPSAPNDKGAPLPAPVLAAEARGPRVTEFLNRASYEIDPVKAGGWSKWEGAYLTIAENCDNIHQVFKLRDDNGAHFPGYNQAVRPEVNEHFRERIEEIERRLWEPPDLSMADA